MALKTIQDYERAGQQDARDPDGPVRFKRSATSWQAQHYWRGYESVAPAEGAEAGSAIRIDRMAANTVGWPKAAAEHARLLALDINTCGPGKRRWRLYRALGRMQKRHGTTPKHHDFPISTQPCPEGPVTLGMLLRGE